MSEPEATRTVAESSPSAESPSAWTVPTDVGATSQSQPPQRKNLLPQRKKANLPRKKCTTKESTKSATESTSAKTSKRSEAFPRGRSTRVTGNRSRRNRCWGSSFWGERERVIEWVWKGERLSKSWMSGVMNERVNNWFACVFLCYLFESVTLL